MLCTRYECPWYELHPLWSLERWILSFTLTEITKFYCSISCLSDVCVWFTVNLDRLFCDLSHPLVCRLSIWFGTQQVLWGGRGYSSAVAATLQQQIDRRRDESINSPHSDYCRLLTTKQRPLRCSKLYTMPEWSPTTMYQILTMYTL